MGTYTYILSESLKYIYINIYIRAYQLRKNSVTMKKPTPNIQRTRCQIPVQCIQSNLNQNYEHSYIETRVES